MFCPSAFSVSVLSTSPMPLEDFLGSDGNVELEELLAYLTGTAAAIQVVRFKSYSLLLRFLL